MDDSNHEQEVRRLDSPNGSSNSTKYRVEPTPIGSTKVPVPPARPEARGRRRGVLPWVLTGIMAVMMLAMLLPRLQEGRSLPSETAAASQTSAVFSAYSSISAPVSAPIGPTTPPSPSVLIEPAMPLSPPKNLRTTLTDGRLSISWGGTVGEYLVRAMDTTDGLPDEEVYEEVRSTGSSATLPTILPGHTYLICVYPADATPGSPLAASTTFSAGKAVSLNKYNLQLASFDLSAYSRKPGSAASSLDASERPASQVAQWLRTGEKGLELHIVLSHQQLNNDRSVHYTLELKAPGGATIALSCDGTLHLASGQKTSCTFDLTDAMRTLLAHDCLNSGWYTVSLNIDGKHAVKHSFHLN